MKNLFISLVSLFVSVAVFAQVTDPQKVIKIGANAELSNHLNLEPGKEYGFLAKDIQELFPALVKEKKVSERFGKNAYRTKTIKVIDEAALITALVASVKKQDIELADLKKKLVAIEKKM